MEFIQSSLLPKLALAKEYLSTKDEPRVIYQDLLAEIDTLIDELPQIKPKIKFISSDLALSKQLKTITEQNSSLKQQYQLQIVSLNVEIRHILHNCELIILAWQPQPEISAKEQRLIQQALSKNIGLGMVIVGDRKITIDSWLEEQTCQLPSEVIFLANSFLTIKDAVIIEQYQDALAQLLPTALAKLDARLSQKLINTVNKSIKKFNQQKWQQIKTQKELYCPEDSIELFRQRVNQLIKKVTKRQQETVQKIKQEVNHQKAILVNPFAENNLIWQTQQIIINSEIEIIKEEKDSYLIPVIKTENDLKKLYLYLADLYQLEFQNHLAQEWSRCDRIYASGGLNQLRQQILAELQPLAHLCDVGLNFKITTCPEFQLSSLAYLPILEAGSKIIFDYHFSDSKWFRLLIAICIGVIIYLVTKLLLGEGRFFGFVIIIFQFINLFTGRDAKTVKLRQHTKELKRILDSKYQVLIRLSAEKITRDLITAIEDEHRHNQQQLEAIAKTVNEKLSAVKKSIESDLLTIARLKQDRQHIVSLLKDN